MKAPLVVCIDGEHRTVEDDRAIDQLMVDAFSGPAGQRALEYLMSISTNACSGPEASCQFLAHREGMRFMVYVIQKRMRAVAARAQQ